MFSHRRDPVAPITLGGWPSVERIRCGRSPLQMHEFEVISPRVKPVFRNPACSLGLQLQSVALRYDGTLVRQTSGTDALRSHRPQVGECDRQSNLKNGRDPRLAYLEAVLFLSRQPLPSRRLANLAKLTDGTEARTLIKTLNQSYDEIGRAFRVEEVAGGFQLRTRSQIAPWLRRMVTSPVVQRMSGPAMETLAVVAYRQPVMRAAIENIRGVQCGEILRQLMERGMVRIAGRADELGRPFLYGTTRNFLEVFGLRSLDELPRASMLRAVCIAGDALANGAEQDSNPEADLEESGVRVTEPGAADHPTTDLEQAQKNLVANAVNQDDDIDDLDDEDLASEEEEDDDGFNDEEWEEVEDEEDSNDEEDSDEEKDSDEEWEDEEWEDDWDDDDTEEDEQEENAADD